MANALKNIPSPTLHRPFAVELWPIFDAAYSKVAGYPPTKFVFVPGVTPMSTFYSCAAMLITYYITIFGGRELMKNAQPFNLNSLFMIHNLYLTIISAVLLVLFIEQLVPTVWANGIFYAICDPRGGWTAPLVTLYYVSSALHCLDAKEASNLIAAQLLDQVPGALGHNFHGPEEKAFDIPPYLSSRSNGTSLLLSASRSDLGLMGAD